MTGDPGEAGEGDAGRAERGIGGAAGPGSPTRPADLSVVVPSVNGERYLSLCLEALLGQEGDAELEIIVADRCGPELRGWVEDRFPGVRVVAADPSATIPRLRALAVKRASAPSVAIIEDHVLVPPDWAERMLEARRGGARVVGGAVKNAATDSLVDRAAFLCEYGHLLGDLPEGPAEWLTGNNTVYDRVLLERNISLLEGGWENRVHDAIRAQGVMLVSRPDVVVDHLMHYTILEYATQKFLYSKSYSGVRAQGFSLLQRLLYGGAALLLPPILSLRIVRSVWKHREHRPDLVKSLHLILFWSVAWAAGDAAGFILGPGRSLEEVR